MRIIVSGCGKIGEAILASLVDEGHDLVAIDSDPEVIEKITNAYDVIGICGSGTELEKLQDAGVEKAELFVSATSSDELNMLSCFGAKRLGAKHTVARIRDSEYNNKGFDFMKQQLELSSTINPERLTAHAIYNIIKFPYATKVESFARRSCEMVELTIKADSPLADTTLIDLRKNIKAKFLICAVQRGQDVYIPGGNFKLETGDKIGLIASPSEVYKVLKALKFAQKTAHDVMILGGSRISYYLTKMLLANDNSVKIIDRDRQRCTELSDILPNKAVVINGDGVEQDLLEEEGINTTDAFVALTGMDEGNILLSVYAMTQNVPKVITKVNQEQLSALADKLGLDCILSPKQITADLILRYARALKNSLGSNVETLYRLMDGKVEALEFKVNTDFKMTDIPLKSLKLKPNILLAGIIRNRETIIPGGDDVIQQGDRVIIVSINRHLYDLADILG